MKSKLILLGLVSVIYFTACTTGSVSDSNILGAITDPVFKAWVSEQMGEWDSDGDGKLSTTEAAMVKKISIATDQKIASLRGIEYFTNLTELYCHDQALKELNVTKNTALEFLNCRSNDITKLDVSKNVALQRLACYDNQLKGLDISKNTNLNTLWCDANPGAKGVFEVTAWFDNDNIPTSGDFTKSKWEFGGKEVTISYRR